MFFLAPKTNVKIDSLRIEYKFLILRLISTYAVSLSI